MTSLSFPTSDEWNRLYDSSPFEKINLQVDEFVRKIHGSQQSSDLMTTAGVIGYVNDLYLRLSYAAKGYILSKFYFDDGIPDEPAYEIRSDGTTIWYPNFKNDDWVVKGWFDFSSSAFYFHLFSSWDTFGHILNDWYQLRLKPRSVYFSNAVTKLKGVEYPLYEGLERLIDSDIYNAAKEIRDNLAHKYLPNMPGQKVFRPKYYSLENMVKDFSILGIKSPVGSKKITENSLAILDLFEKSVILISDSWK
ncbi:MAG: Cthe_2314 family HEPN domain-containing protein [Anaerolineales bacterium]|nr:MAG: Cthe_2314 family HEPN domain-containing protein [Anaerolineales bacterium]